MTTMKVYESGQSAVEFAVAVSVLIALLLAIPILAKIANANIMTIQALDYAAWRVREGNTDNDALSREVNDRYFGETALVVDDKKINHQGAMLGTGRDNEQIYQNGSVTVNYTANNEDMGGGTGKLWNNVDRSYNLGLNDKKGVVSINVPLENLDVLPEIASSTVIRKSIYIDNQALTARDKVEIQDNMNGFGDIIIPYNDGLQSKSNELVNGAMDLMRVIPVDVLDHHQLEDIDIDHDAVPEDRLARFEP